MLYSRPYMGTFDSYRKKYAALYAAVKDTHEASAYRHRGHGLDHDVAVAQMAVFIAPTTQLADKGWIAGLIHSTDRLVEASEYTKRLRSLLALLPIHAFSAEEVEEIYIAIFEHDQKSPTHRSPTQEILQDADKLVNMQATLVIRAGQFHANIPTIELSYLKELNPASTYSRPRSVLDNIRIIALEYPSLIHTEKGKELASRYAQRLREYERQVLDDHEKLGIVGIEL